MPLNIPVVVGSSHLFASRLEYAAEPERYYFWLDREIAHRRESGDFAPQEYRTLLALARQYPELFRNVIEFHEFNHDDFYVLRNKASRPVQTTGELQREMEKLLLLDVFR